MAQSQIYHRKQIEDCKDDLEETIDLTGGLLSSLRSYHVIKQRQESQIKKNSDKFEQVSNLLDLVAPMPEDRFLPFAAALIHTNQEFVVRDFFPKLLEKAKKCHQEIKEDRYDFQLSNAEDAQKEAVAPVLLEEKVTAVVTPVVIPVAATTTNQDLTPSSAVVSGTPEICQYELMPGEIPVETHLNKLEPGDNPQKHRNKWSWLKVVDVKRQNKPYTGNFPGRKIGIAILDSGISDIHSDVKDLVFKKENFVMMGEPDLGMDEKGHGTACAGVIADAHLKDSPFIQLYNLKVVPAKATPSTADISRALQRLSEADYNGVDIVSISLGTQKINEAIANSIQSLWPRKVIVVSAANHGNRAQKSTRPLTQENTPMICVGSCDQFGNRSKFSSRGPTLFCLAPGEVISARSKTVDDYYLCEGTSFATPWVAAIAAHVIARAEMLHQQIGATLDAIRGKLCDTRVMMDVLREGCTLTNKPHSEEEGFGVLSPVELFYPTGNPVENDQHFIAIIKRHTGL